VVGINSYLLNIANNIFLETMMMRRRQWAIKYS